LFCRVSVRHVFDPFFSLSPSLIKIVYHHQDTIKAIVKQFLGDDEDQSVLLRSTEAADFHEDVQMYLIKLEDDGVYRTTVQRLQSVGGPEPVIPKNNLAPMMALNQ
jgi:hypothetical protein